ncbi:DedA family protein [Corynebacterium doosanense]|nr:VTT domain-containing protein [Corynebacterium doosanense]
MEGYPFWVIWVLLYLGATFRGQATYWIGRGVRSGALRGSAGPGWWRRTRDRINQMDTRRARQLLDTIGPLAIPLAYLTVGLQSAIIITAGLTHLGWARFSIAQVPGAAAWATIYSTIGFAAWAGMISALAGDWWPLAVLIVALIAVGAVIAFRRRGRQAAVRA